MLILRKKEEASAFSFFSKTGRREKSDSRLYIRAQIVYHSRWRCVGTAHGIKKGIISKRRKDIVYQNNTMARYVQAIISKEDFLIRFNEWIETVNDEHMQALRRFIFEINIGDQPLLSDALYTYGSSLTESNYLGRKFFEQMVLLVKNLDEPVQNTEIK